MLFVSHDLRLVRHLAHEVAVMYLGRIVEYGSADAVLDMPQHPYTQALLRAAPPSSTAATPNRPRCWSAMDNRPRVT